MPRYWLYGLLLLLPAVVFAATPPSQEFWEYMADFSDENGEVLDPLELDEAISVKEQDGYDAGQNRKEATSKSAPDNSEGHVKNADLKTTTTSSATTASRKGATL